MEGAEIDRHQHGTACGGIEVREPVARPQKDAATAASWQRDDLAFGSRGVKA